MTSIHAKYSKLRDVFRDDPESLKRIEDEETRVTALLKKKEYYSLDTTKELINLCRRDVITARKKLATVRELTEEGRAELWAIVDARQWFIERVAQNYDAELNSIEQELEAELDRS